MAFGHLHPHYPPVCPPRGTAVSVLPKGWQDLIKNYAEDLFLLMWVGLVVALHLVLYLVLGQHLLHRGVDPI